jgi:hypothetical protein
MDDGRYWHKEYGKHDCFKKCVLELATGGPQCFGFASPANSSNKGCYLHVRNFSQSVTEHPNSMPFETHSKWQDLVNTSAWMCYSLISNQTEEDSMVQGESLEGPLEELSACVEDHLLGPYSSIEVLRVGSTSSSMYWFTLLDVSRDRITFPVSESDWELLFDDRCPLPEEPVTSCDCVGNTPEDPLDCDHHWMGNTPEDPLDCDQHWMYVAVVEFLVICALVLYIVYMLRRAEPEPDKHYRYQRVEMVDSRVVDVVDITGDSYQSGLNSLPNASKRHLKIESTRM